MATCITVIPIALLGLLGELVCRFLRSHWLCKVNTNASFGTEHRTRPAEPARLYDQAICAEIHPADAHGKQAVAFAQESI